MATIQIQVCDSCGCKNDKQQDLIKSVFISTHYTPCPAGGSSELDGVKFDLCSRCLVYLVDELLKHIDDFDKNKKLVNTVKEWSKRNGNTLQR